MTVVVDADDYPKVMENIKANSGATTEDFRFYLAKKVYATTADYDRANTEYLSGVRR